MDYEIYSIKLKREEMASIYGDDNIKLVFSYEPKKNKEEYEFGQFDVDLAKSKSRVFANKFRLGRIESQLMSLKLDSGDKILDDMRETKKMINNLRHQVRSLKNFISGNIKNRRDLSEVKETYLKPTDMYSQIDREDLLKSIDGVWNEAKEKCHQDKLFKISSHNIELDCILKSDREEPLEDVSLECCAVLSVLVSSGLIADATRLAKDILSHFKQRSSQMTMLLYLLHKKDLLKVYNNHTFFF